MDGGRSWLGGLALALATSAVLVFWYAGSNPQISEALDSSAESARPPPPAGGPRRSEDSVSTPERTAAVPRDVMSATAKHDEGEERSVDPLREPETEAEYLARFRALIRRDPEQFDLFLIAHVDDLERPLPERVAIARAAWQERRPGWGRAYRAGLATLDSSRPDFGRAVQRWLSDDAAAHEEVRAFMQESLWGSDPLATSSRGRRELALDLSAAVPDEEWRSVESQLRAESDTEVLRSALTGRGRRLSPEAANELFERFGLEAPPDLFATEEH